MENLDNQQKELAWTEQIELKKKKERRGSQLGLYVDA